MVALGMIKDTGMAKNTRNKSIHLLQYDPALTEFKKRVHFFPIAKLLVRG